MNDALFEGTEKRRVNCEKGRQARWRRRFGAGGERSERGVGRFEPVVVVIDDQGAFVLVAVHLMATPLYRSEEAVFFIAVLPLSDEETSEAVVAPTEGERARRRYGLLREFGDQRGCGLEEGGHVLAGGMSEGLEAVLVWGIAGVTSAGGNAEGLGDDEGGLLDESRRWEPHGIGGIFSTEFYGGFVQRDPDGDAEVKEVEDRQWEIFEVFEADDEAAQLDFAVIAREPNMDDGCEALIPRFEVADEIDPVGREFGWIIPLEHDVEVEDGIE